MQGGLVMSKLSVERVHCNKTEERYVQQISIPDERSLSPIFREERLVGTTPST